MCKLIVDIIYNLIYFLEYFNINIIDYLDYVYLEFNDNKGNKDSLILKLYYFIYIKFYTLYKIIKLFFVLFYFKILKFYVIFVNDSLFFSFNNSLFKFFFKSKKWINYILYYIRIRIFKRERKIKNYYDMHIISYLKIFLFISLFYFIILMWKNRITYFKLNFFGYPLLFYVLVLNLSIILVPLFYYKFIIIFIILLLVLIICYILILN